MPPQNQTLKGILVAQATLSPAGPSLVRGLWHRQLGHYPSNGKRTVYLGISVLSTIVLYYELFVQGSVATQILAHFHMSFKFFGYVLIVGNGLGAFASLAAGLADRWGRANLVTYGLAISGLLILFGLPNAGSEAEYMVLFTLLSLVEGVLLVATPALIRDFSPQLGRASAMGFWTLGPVVGSLLVTEISSHTLTSHPEWQYQFHIAGIVGLAVFVVALIGLRELSPRLRDQLMVSLHDRALIEARAAGIDPDALLKNHWRQMLHLDVVGSAFAVSLLLLFYYVAVTFFVVYFVTTFGYTEAHANDLANWYWIANAIALVITGVVSDFFKVRKPFMILGGLIGAVGVALFATRATDPTTGYYTFAWIMVVIATGSGIAYCAWMASFTETVERHNPAATATGLAVWGWIVRMVVAVSFIGLTSLVSSASPLVDDGPRAQALAAQYSTQLQTLQTIDPATLAALSANPRDQAAGLKAVSELVAPQGIQPATVLKLAVLQKQYPQQIATLQTVDIGTLLTLQRSPTNQTAINKAVSELIAKFGGTPADAAARLAALQQVPQADLVVLVTSGPAVAQAEAQLLSASAIPKADLTLLQTVQQAQKDSPHQWQQWWWICFAGQLAFLPFVFVMAGRWSPRKARQDILAHENAIDQEMVKLGLKTAG
jgi:MFS transporter, ACS family, D-galactonate transporter